jgi:ABC-type sulfate transport system permease component
MESASMLRARKRKWASIRCLYALALALTSPSYLFAQGCALCYTQAAGAGSRFIHALRSGILVLSIPPMLIGIGLAIITYKKRNLFDEE